MHNFFRKLVGTGVVCGMLVFAAPLTSMAAIGPGFAAGTYVATVTAESVNINKNRDSEEVLFTAKAGSTYEVLGLRRRLDEGSGSRYRRISSGF